MSEVQVSNARRVVFTAMALVVFWVVAWRAYGLGIEWESGPIVDHWFPGGPNSYSAWEVRIIYDPWAVFVTCPRKRVQLL